MYYISTGIFVLSLFTMQAILMIFNVLSNSDTHPYTHTHAHTHSLSNSLTHTHSHSLTLTHSLTHSLTHTHSLTLTHSHTHIPLLDGVEFAKRNIGHKHNRSHSAKHKPSAPTAKAQGGGGIKSVKTRCPPSSNTSEKRRRSQQRAP